MGSVEGRSPVSIVVRERGGGSVVLRTKPPRQVPPQGNRLSRQEGHNNFLFVTDISAELPQLLTADFKKRNPPY